MGCPRRTVLCLRPMYAPRSEPHPTKVFLDPPRIRYLSTAGVNRAGFSSRTVGVLNQ